MQTQEPFRSLIETGTNEFLNPFNLHFGSLNLFTKRVTAQTENGGCVKRPAELSVPVCKHTDHKPPEEGAFQFSPSTSWQPVSGAAAWILPAQRDGQTTLTSRT